MEIIYCADGNPRFAGLAIAAGFKYGAQLPKKVYFPPYFADQDFKRPRYTGYIRALRKYRPPLASVLDIMEWRRLDEYLMRAEEVSQYCTEVMLIPKITGVIEELPREVNGKKVRLGYSIDTGFGRTDVPIEEFEGWPVHLLGGSPTKQLEKAKEMNTAKVVSSDGNYAQLMSRYNQFFFPEFLWDEEYRRKVEEKLIRNPIWPTLLEFDGQLWGDGSSKADAPYEAFRRSCQGIMKMWKEYLNCETKTV